MGKRGFNESENKEHARRLKMKSVFCVPHKACQGKVWSTAFVKAPVRKMGINIPSDLTFEDSPNLDRTGWRFLTPKSSILRFLTCEQSSLTETNLILPFISSLLIDQTSNYSQISPLLTILRDYKTTNFM